LSKRASYPRSHVLTLRAWQAWNARSTTKDGADSHSRLYPSPKDLGLWSPLPSGRSVRAPRTWDGHGDGIARVDLSGLRVRAEAGWGCAASKPQRAGVQGAGDPGRSLCLERSRKHINREAVGTGPIPAGGLPRTRIAPPRKCRTKVVWISLADQKRGFEIVLWYQGMSSVCPGCPQTTPRQARNGSCIRKAYDA
jgi:hypothetical protein